MPFLKQLIILLLVFVLSSCHKKSGKYPYAIKDFPIKVQPHLSKIVETGIYTGMDDVLEQQLSDAELTRLARSEHPLLRVAAFHEIFNRNSFNHYDMIMGHLDDTALIFIDAGEFGVWDRTVSDDILQAASWNKEEEKDKTVDEVMTKHNYLRSAYIILGRIDAKEKYYGFIKDMATRPRQLDFQNYELRFGDIEYALYGLAKFKKKQDVAVIKNILMTNVWRLSDISFNLMREFPDTAYFEVLETYHRRQFYRFSGNRKGGFSSVVEDGNSPEDFIKALVAQQTNRSAKLLDTLLTGLQMPSCMPDRENIVNNLIEEIWIHHCPAYVTLREKIKSRAEKLLQSRMEIPMEPRPVDTTRKVYRW